MKRYLFSVAIEEGNDEFWEKLNGTTGCEQVTEVVEECFAHFGFYSGENVTIKLVKFEDVE